MSVSVILRRFPRFATQTANRRIPAATFSTATKRQGEQHYRTSILTNIEDHPGSLLEVLKDFSHNGINLTHIESRPCPKDSDGFHIKIDFDGHIGDKKTDQLLIDLKGKCKDMLVLDDRQVPWYPHHISELDSLANRCLDAGTDLEADHPGFSDMTYRARRGELASIAERFTFGEPIPRIEYTPEEVATWGAVYTKLQDLHAEYACSEYLESLHLLEKHCGYSKDNIPQAEDISQYLLSRTGFRLRPVTGLLSSRDFLNGLAFRSFFSTQYIRHHSRPLYTPEPDICHELLGHVPMFADPDFADFSQEIGLASLGASEEDIKRLATCYWHSVEFGLLRQRVRKPNDPNNSLDDASATTVKAYGAGLLSSFGELVHGCRDAYFPPLHSTTTTTTTADSASASAAKKTAADFYAGATEASKAPAPPSATPGSTDEVAAKPTLLPWDPTVACTTGYPITTYQPLYFVAENLADAKLKMRAFCESLQKPFHARYNPLTNTIWVDRAVKGTKSTDAN